MKITPTAQKINLNNVVDIAVDVHKDTLCFFIAIDGQGSGDECRNHTAGIEKRLRSYHDIAGTWQKDPADHLRAHRPVPEQPVPHRQAPGVLYLLKQTPKIAVAA